MSLAIAPGLLSEYVMFTVPVYVIQLSTHENVGISMSSIPVSVIGRHGRVVPHESATLPDIVNNHPVHHVVSKFIMTPVSHHRPMNMFETFWPIESISSIVTISHSSNVPLNCKLTS